MKSAYWFVSTIYEMSHIEKFVPIKELVEKLAKHLEQHLQTEMVYFATSKDGTTLYLMKPLGVFGINILEKFQLKGFFSSERDAVKFKKTLLRAIKHSLPEEIASEMESTMIIAEKII